MYNNVALKCQFRGVVFRFFLPPVWYRFMGWNIRRSPAVKVL